MQIVNYVIMIPPVKNAFLVHLSLDLSVIETVLMVSSQILQLTCVISACLTVSFAQTILSAHFVMKHIIGMENHVSPNVQKEDGDMTIQEPASHALLYVLHVKILKTVLLALVAHTNLKANVDPSALKVSIRTIQLVHASHVLSHVLVAMLLHQITVRVVISIGISIMIHAYMTVQLLDSGMTTSEEHVGNAILLVSAAQGLIKMNV